MRHPWLAACAVLMVLGLGSLLQACGPTPEQRRQAAEQQRQHQQAMAQLQRCRRDQPAVTRLSAAIQNRSQALERLNQERYQPSARPEPPDPALASRFTQEDRELDELRYRDQLRSWEEAEQLRYGRWLGEQHRRRDQLRSQLQIDASLLRRIAPQLLEGAAGSTLRPAAVAKGIRCAPADFGLQNSAVEGSSSRAAAS